MKRKLVSLLLAAVMVLSLCPTLNLWAGAEEMPVYDIVHTFSSGKIYFNSGTGTIVGAQVSGEVEIPGQIQGHDVLVIGDHAFSNFMGDNPITAVTVPEGVVTIEPAAFNYCQQLREIQLPGSLRSIGGTCFGNTILREVTIPEGVESMGDEVFYNCRSLKRVSLPDSLVQMGIGTFYQCGGLESVRLPATMTRIENSTFKACEKLVDITFPSTLRVIGEEAFMDCKSLKEIVLLDGFTTLEQGAFRSCEAVERVVLPESMTEIGDHAFYMCKSLPEITLPSGLKKIGNSAFSNNYMLAPVTLPETLEVIGNNAFNSCNKFTHITFPENLKVIGDLAFANCDRLEGIDLPEGLEKLGYNAFYGSDEITYHENGSYLDGWYVGTDRSSYTVRIKEGTIGVADGSVHLYYPYESDSHGNVNTVYIPKTVIHMDRDAFGDKNKISSIIVDSGNPVFSVQDNILYNKDKTELIFCGMWVWVKDVTYPTSLKKIRDNAFRNCEDLLSVILPDGVEYVGKYAFAGTGLQEIHMGSSVELIDDHAFASCRDLACVYFTGDAPQIGEQIFSEGYEPILFYADGKAGWTYPRWNGYATAVMKDSQLGSTAFSDVAADAYYAEAVGWAVSQSITNGTGGGTFSPDTYCLRGQIVTFLWRAAGCPEPETKDNPFTDVSDREYFYKAVLWAVENGITNGTGDGLFSPYYSCNRAQAVTFLWRAMGGPKATSSQNPFTDVAPDAYYYDAVLWAVENGITNGVSATSFAPTKTCTRAQIVTFLYRTYE